MNQSRTFNPWIVLIVLVAGNFMILLDTTVVNIAIPNMIDSLHSSLDSILWVLNGYILVYAVLLITAGRLGDLYGQRNLFIIGLVIFTAASAYCGLAPDTTHLIVARVIQGIGGALLTPQTLSMLTNLFPPERRGAAFGVWGAMTGVAAVAGPTLGGFLITTFDWRSIFFINLPVGVATLIAGFILVPDMRSGREHRLDIPGVLLASAGLFPIVYALIEGQRYKWGSIAGPLSIPLLLAVGVVLLVVFVLFERGVVEPLVPLALFRDRNFSIMNWVGLVVTFGMLGLFLPLTIYFQSALGMTALQAGVALAPMSIVSMVLSPFAGQVSDKIGGKYVLLVGLLIFSAGLATIPAVASTTSTGWTFLPSFIVSGVGLGFVFAPMATVAMRNVQPALAGAASGVYNTTRQIGAVLGTAVVGAILENQLAADLPKQAAAAASQIPAAFRQQFIQGLSQASSAGLEVGPGQNGGLQLPPNISPAVAQQLQQIVHTVFVNAFTSAVRPALIVPVIVMLVGALSTAFIKRRQAAARPTEQDPEAELALAS